MLQSMGLQRVRLDLATERQEMLLGVADLESTGLCFSPFREILFLQIIFQHCIFLFLFFFSLLLLFFFFWDSDSI